MARTAAWNAEPMTGAEDDVPAALARLGRRRFGATAQVRKVTRLSGGASQELWSFDVATEADLQPLILRRNPGGAARADAAGMETEARLIRSAAVAGAPVPAVVHVLDARDGLGAGYVMARVEGEALAPRLLRDPLYAEARPRLARQLGEAAARIHAIVDDQMPVRGPAEVLAEAQASFASLCPDRPVLAWALRWLRERRPAPGRTTVVHGDLRNGNIMVGAEGLRAVLDWEGVHRGDPMEDLGYLCVTSWRFREIDKPVGGFGPREEMFAGYASGGGGDVDPDRVRWWEVVGVLRWGLICAMMADEFARGDRSVEKAAIGRRLSETELDLLAMLAPRGGYVHA